MSEYNLLADRIAQERIRERVADASAARLVPHRNRGRHTLANRLHSLADRIDR
ncbi:MAG: hypothetical protein ACXVXC_13080 [Nocardioidaceae bacterium]